MKVLLVCGGKDSGGSVARPDIKVGDTGPEPRPFQQRPQLGKRGPLPGESRWTQLKGPPAEEGVGAGPWL